MHITESLLVWTTLPYLAALLWAPPLPYSAIVITSTMFSVCWHLAGGSASTWFGILDHEVAALWFLADCYYLAARQEEFTLMLALNGGIAATDLVVTWLDHADLIPYYIGHSAWHLVSAAKAFFVAGLIAQVARL